MKRMSQHTEWLSLIEVSGPFLVVSELEKVFPQGLDVVETPRRQRVRAAYEEWCDAVDENDPQLAELHREWIHLVLSDILEYDGDVLRPNENLEKPLSYFSPEHAGNFRPDFVIKGNSDIKPKFIISIQPPGTDLEKVKVGDGWPASLLERMTLLCRQEDVRLGLLTNGERWMLVNAPIGSTSGNASWYARLWFQEPVTLKAFQSLLGIRRCFGPKEETLDALLEESLKHQEEVTDTLGEQVKRAVEVLVQCLDKADQDRNRELLRDVPPAELYEAGLTVMMRLVFILCAEERGLLLLDEQIYEQNYAVSSLRAQLDEEADRHGPEVLERRHDAWARLLAAFRAVYGGIEHETLRMPALGGSLFDPDRFPFLEGRAKGTSWRDVPAKPLPIDNRTVLLLLNALQILEQRSGALLLSYKALDVEQIGHVYEGLLEHTVARVPEVTLGLEGSQKAKNPNVSLAEMESARLDGVETLAGLIEEATKRSKAAIQNALKKDVDDATYAKVVAECGGDMELAKRIRPYANLLRADAWGDFIVYKANSFAVTLGADRRETGTHYTPKSLTESIVSTTLEPVAYTGPAEGIPREEWKLKSSAELLDLKVCDPAMGSGAFLVQACRWLSERVIEAWGNEEKLGKFVTVDGEVLDELAAAEPMPKSLDDRLVIARRLVAERCLYGVDINPLAVELAKLSIWLVTLAKGRPFGFLDHNLRSGDSLLGIHRLDQLTKLTMNPDDPKIQPRLFGKNIEQAVSEAMEIRKKLRQIPIRDIRDVETMAKLDEQAKLMLEGVELVADAMIGEALCSNGNAGNLNSALDALAGLAQEFLNGNEDISKAILKRARQSLSVDLFPDKPLRKPLHWPLEFPEVFECGGFDGIVGNPPFMGGRHMRAVIGDSMMTWLVLSWPHASLNADYCAFFYLRAAILLKSSAGFGFLATKTIGQGDTARTGLSYLADKLNCSIRYVISSFVWPGKAAVVAAIIIVQKSKWVGDKILDGHKVTFISPVLDDQGGWDEAYGLFSNKNKSFQGSVLVGLGFVLTTEEAQSYLHKRRENQEVIKPYLSGDDLNSHPTQLASRWAIDFRDASLEECEEKWPELLERIRQLVKPQRDKTRRKAHRKYWWHHGDKRPALYEAIRNKNEVYVITAHTKYIAIVKVAARQIFQHALHVFNLECRASFACLQSTFHDIWTRRGSSSLGDTLRYTTSDSFDTYPFLHLNNAVLNAIGEKYYECRRNIMEARLEGLTSTYNRLHDPDNSDEDFKAFRELYAEMDKTVAVAYGWNDLDLGHGFHETKQGLRFTISEKARREVLQRLLRLNHERYVEEVAQGLHDKGVKNKKSKKTEEKELF